MENYKAVISEKTYANFGKTFASTKGSLKYYGMNKEEFYQAVKYNQCFNFEIIEF